MARYSWSLDCNRPNHPIASTTALGDAHANPYPNIHFDSNRYADAHINGHASTDWHGHTRVGSPSNSNCQSDGYLDTNKDINRYSDDDQDKNQDADRHIYSTHTDRKASKASKKDSVRIAVTVPPGDVQ